MNRVTREHYPASRLPDDLRGSIHPSHRVTVTVIEEDAPERVMTLEEIFESTKEYRTLSAADIDARIRAIRDEWDA